MQDARLTFTPDEIKAFRAAEGLTQEQLAARLRLSHKDTVRAWESGKTPISGPAAVVIRMVQMLREGGKGVTNAIIEGVWNGA